MGALQLPQMERTGGEKCPKSCQKSVSLFCCFTAGAVRRQRALYILLVSNVASQARFGLYLVRGHRPWAVELQVRTTYCIPGPETSRTCKSR